MNVNSIFQQRLDEIQSRIPVKLTINNQKTPLDSNSLTEDTVNFQSLLKQEMNSLNAVPSKKSVVSDDLSYIYSVIEEACLKNNVDSNLIKAIVKAESSFNPKTVSHAGAMGLMQLMPFNAEEMGVTDPFDIVQNINAGVKMIKGHLEKYNGDLSLALAAYNAGSGAVRKYGGVPPYTETQNYIKKVVKYTKEYENA